MASQESSQESSGKGARSPKLDDLMMAMDVVDTLRHEKALVEREFEQSNRDETLKERLRKIYEGQGLEVTDEILDEGIAALKESRFTYERKGSALSRKLAMLWVKRSFVGAVLGILLLLGGGFVGTSWWQESSALQQKEAARIELSQTLPSQIETSANAALAEAQTPEAKQAVHSLAQQAAGALSRSDAAAARKAVAEIGALRDELSRSYNLMIVQRGRSAVETAPDINVNARNYYLLVEAVTPGGRKLSLPIANEETGDTETVSVWGVHVPEQTYLQVRNDKLNDGIIQNRILGVKQRGALKPVYNMPVSGGAITKW